MSTGLGVVVLAAGRGTRMKSALPKVLHPVCGRPMAAYVLDAARQLDPDRMAVVVGFGADRVREALAAPDVVFVDQAEQLGTADAVRRCEETLAGCAEVLVLNGDSPLITVETLRPLVEARGDAPFAFLTCLVPDSGSFGRVLRDVEGHVRGIVEGPGETAGVAERNAGQYLFDGSWLWSRLGSVPLSDRGEYYLTDLARIAVAEGRPPVACTAPAEDVMGFDDRVGLAEAERLMRRRILERHMLSGVTIVDPATAYVDASVTLAADTTILPNCYLYGTTRVATGSVIGPGTTLRNADIGPDCRVQSSVIEDSRLGARVRAGPFAHVRGGADIGDDCELGNYAEVKNSNLGPRVKMHHFSYLGDADVGADVNYAAGAITNNYDGVRKHRTTIGARAFIGCDTMLIAPVTVGDDARTGSGAVVTHDVPSGTTVVGVPARPFPAKRAE
jgi:bifunctional UDP-N-acetylglucosamine pyrophosphorylase/glucosamine-1-phosphate N-acetyltransferase